MHWLTAGKFVHISRIVSSAHGNSSRRPGMNLSKEEVGLLLALVGILATLGLSPVLVLASLVSFLVGRLTR